MNRTGFLIACAATVAILMCAHDAAAQPPAPGGAMPRPTFSPYLNLTRGGGTPALNYYGLVRPEQQFRQSLNGLQGAVANNQQSIGALQQDGVDGPSATGHQSMFMNYGGYFMNNGSGQSGGGSQGNGSAMSAPKASLGKKR